MLLDVDCDPDLEDEDGLTATEMAARCAQYGYAGIITKWKKDVSEKVQVFWNQHYISFNWFLI